MSTVVKAMTPRARAWSIVGAAVLVATAVGLVLDATTPSLAVMFGFPDLGTVVDAGLPAARTVAVIAASAVVGNLLLAAVLVPGEARGPVSGIGYGGLLAARPWSLLLAAASLVVAMLVAAENVGLGVGQLVARPDILASAVAAVEPATGWFLLACAAVVVAAASGLILSWRGSVALLLVMLAGVVAPPMTAAGVSEEAHDWSGDALTLHTVAAVLWLGSTIAVVTRLPSAPAIAAVVLRRHRRIASGSLVVLVLSAVAPTLLSVRPGDLLGSGFGLIVVASLILSAALGGVLTRTRPRRSAAAPRIHRGWWIATELVLLVGAAVLGTVLSRLIAPLEDGADASRLVYLLGYELPGPAQGLELLLRWRIDLLYAPLAALAAAGYLLAVRRLRRAGQGWPLRRTVCWLAGCAVVLIATSSGIGTYATAVFSVHMTAHMLLGAVAPLLLVCGHGVTLALRVCRPGVRARLVSLRDAPPLRLAAQPVAVWVITAVSVFGLYATGLFDTIVVEHWSHPLMDAVALGAGLLLFWVLLGHSPPGPPLPPLAGIATVFAVMAVHAGFAVWMLSRSTPVGERFYAALALLFVPDLLADQRAGAIAAWVIGEAAVLAAVVVLIRRWTRHGEQSPDAGDYARLAAPERSGLTVRSADWPARRLDGADRGAVASDIAGSPPPPGAGDAPRSNR
ncbi:putative copper resistance protein D [Pseudonocardia sediminis]|uniref:Putative copper resistance protein D n=1 Tax=Pseudonocardia sediminis TaxID=1397368 RepID=A0A4Q7UV02_PSEST|nr:cytochrome c oxidase assembly protein [Pseudonocardia sediminis]RZT85606.1 putative copper resistance protein D [Pseudonocardia sediminis]